MMKNWINKKSEQIWAPIDTASVVLFRVGFGLLMFWEMCRYFYFDWVKDLFATPQFHFQYEWFQWVTPLPGNGMYVVFLVLAITALMIAFGLFYRLATVVFFIGYTYVFLIDRATYNNHFYLLCLISLMLTLAPLHKSWSLDAIRGAVTHTDKLPALWLWLIRFHMGMVYVYGGIAKFDPDWLNGSAARELLGVANRGTLFEPLMQYVWVHYFYAWSGLIFDLLIPFLMLYKPIRYWAFVSAIIFHTNNYFVFPIGVFPILALLITLIYFDADFPRKLFPKKIKAKISTHYRKWIAKNDETDPLKNNLITKPIKLFIGAYIIIQLVLPFRHLLYPGWTIWHEKGHYFSWRMMLRQKVTKIKYNVTHPVTGEQRYAIASDYLNSSQHKVFAGKPAMILLLAHHLDALVKKNAGFDPIITANVEVSLNGRAFRTMVDPNLDLSKIPPYQPSFIWIIPFGER